MPTTALPAAGGGGGEAVPARDEPDDEVVVDATALLLPVHLAAAADALPTLRWLCEEHHCPLQGAMTLGKPQKSVLRVAIEARAIDVLQWMVAGEGVPRHVVGVPCRMPSDSGCSAPALHRALEAALLEGVRTRALLSQTLEAVAALGGTEPPPLEALQPQPRPPSRSSLPASSPNAPGGTPGDEDEECVVCMAAPKECVLLECAHACVCEQCAGTLIACPLCRRPIDRVVRIFK